MVIRDIVTESLMTGKRLPFGTVFQPERLDRLFKDNLLDTRQILFKSYL